MTDLLAELERVRGLVAAYDEGDRHAFDAACFSAVNLIRRPDFLALIEALREPVGYLRSARMIVGNGFPDYDTTFFEEVREVAPGTPLYALPTKERDDG